MKTRDVDIKTTSGVKQGVLSIINEVLRDVFKVAPKLMTLYVILSIFHGISFGLVVVLQQRFFDCTAGLISRELTFAAAMSSLLLAGTGYIVNQVLNGLAGFVPNILIKKAGGYLSSKIHMKISGLPPIIFEATEKLDDINKAEHGKNNALRFTFAFLDILLFYIPYFAFMSLYLYSLHPSLIFSVVLVFFPTVFSQLIRTKLFGGAEDKAASIRRENDYYEECLISRDYYKETRLLGGFTFFKNKYQETLSSLQKIQYKAAIKTGYFELGVTFLSILGYSTILYLLFTSLMSGGITVGSFAAVYASIGWMYDFMEDVINNRISDMSQNIGTVRNYLNFIKLEEQNGHQITFNNDLAINIENVCFSYPGTNNESVKNVSLSIRAGETIALVGENGSGKTTLIRLITGLYLPDKGRITYNEKDIRELSRTSLYKNTSAVFQKYQRYQMTLKENISISNSEVRPEKSNLDIICKYSGLEPQNIAIFPDGYDTMLSKEFNGVDLSGGQWQSVAVARAFFKTHNLIILDEPTSSIDPYEETKIYNQFAQMCEGKTSIIVTHRLAPAKLADRVIVMKEGEIVEAGTHSELLKQDGEYSRLYESQRFWYADEEPLILPSIVN